MAYPGSSAQQRSQCSTRISAGAGVGCGSLLVILLFALKNNGNSVFDIRSLMWDEWSYPEGVILPIVTLGTIRPECSGAA